MPIYEFQCQACGTEIEVLQKINDPHITDCEACGKSEMKKKVTAAAFRLSGAGWYETDFKEGDKKKNLTETNSDKKDQSSADSKNEASKKETSNKGSKEASTKASEKSLDKATTKTETSKTDSKKPINNKDSKKD